METRMEIITPMHEHERIYTSPLQTTIEPMQNTNKVMMEFRNFENELLFCIHMAPHVAIAHAEALIEAADSITRSTN